MHSFGPDGIILAFVLSIPGSLDEITLSSLGGYCTRLIDAYDHTEGKAIIDIHRRFIWADYGLIIQSGEEV